MMKTFQYDMEVCEDPVEYGIWRKGRTETTMMEVAKYNALKPALKRGFKLDRTFKAYSWELAQAVFCYIEHGSAYKPANWDEIERQNAKRKK